MVLQLDKTKISEKYELKEYELDTAEINHMRRVGIISKELAEKLEVQNVDIVHKAGKLHDIGKKFIRPGILNKPTFLTKDEYEIIKGHAFYSAYEALNKGYKIEIVNNLLFHHENYDGSGYYGLKAEEIPLGARIIRVADVYDALTMDRPYKSKLNNDEALSVMEKEKENFDPKIFAIFKKIIKQEVS